MIKLTLTLVLTTVSGCASVVLDGRLLDYTPSICADIGGERLALRCDPVDDDGCEYTDPGSGQVYQASWAATCPAVYCGSDACLTYGDS